MFESFSIAHASKEGIKNVRREVQVLLFFTLVPLAFAFIGTFYFDGALNAFFKIFLQGNLYYYAVSLGASIFIVTQLSGHKSLYWVKIWSALFVVFVAVLLTFYIGQSPIIAQLPQHGMIFNLVHATMSVLIFCFAYFVYFRVRVLADEPPPNPEDVHRKEVVDQGQNVGEGYD